MVKVEADWRAGSIAARVRESAALYSTLNLQLFPADGAELLQCLEHSCAAHPLRHVTTCVAYHPLHRLDRVGRARHPFREAAIQHRDVVEVITRSEDLVRLELAQAREFSERR